MSSEKSKRETQQPEDKAYTSPPDSDLRNLDPVLGDRDFFLDVMIKALAIGEITASQFALMHLALINRDMARLILKNLHKVFPVENSNQQ